MTWASQDDLLAALPPLFAASHLQEIAWYGHSDLISCAREFLEGEGLLAPEPTLAAVLHRAFEILQRRRPVEYIYKTCVMRRRVFGRHSPNSTSVYFEHDVGEARADLVLVNGRTDVFEIKSRYDGPDRLASQLHEYYRCFPRVTIVTHESKAEMYLAQAPVYTGVSIVDDRFYLSCRRPVSDHFDELDHYSLFALLHQGERDVAGERLGLPIEEIPPWERDDAIYQLFKTRWSAMHAYEEVKGALFQRKNRALLARKCAMLPWTLHTAFYSYTLRKRDWVAIMRALDRKLLPKTDARCTTLTCR